MYASWDVYPVTWTSVLVHRRPGHILAMPSALSLAPCSDESSDDHQHAFAFHCRGWVSFIGLRQKLLSESLPQALPVDVLNGMLIGSTQLLPWCFGHHCIILFQLLYDVAVCQ